MSFSLVSDRLNQIASALDQSMPDVISQGIMVDLLEMHKKRIFQNGLNSENKPIGKYDTSPAYFSENKFVRKKAFIPTGKPDQNGNKRTGNFQNGNQRKSMFIATGYAGLRDIQGRDGLNINLKYSGSLELSLQVMKFGNSVMYGNLDPNEVKKFESLQERFLALYLSENEKNFIIHEIEIEAEKNIPKP